MQGSLNIKLLINSKYEHLNEKETSQYIQEKVLKIQHLFVILKLLAKKKLNSQFVPPKLAAIH